MKPILTTLLGIAVLLFVTAGASAQSLTVFVGGNVGAESGASLRGITNEVSRLNMGARVSTMIAGIFGSEIDVGYTPDFYGTGTGARSSRLLTVMGDVVVGIPAGFLHPYALAGVGLIRRTVTWPPAPGGTQVSQTDSSAAYAIGGGVDLSVIPHLGVNAEIRYFRNFARGNPVLDPEDEPFSCVRGSVGISVRF